MSLRVPPFLAKEQSTVEVYAALAEVLAALSEVRIEEKASSLHVVAGKAAFLGVHPRRQGLRINVVLDRPLEGQRIAKADQVSKKRFHNEIDVKASSELDAELRDWIQEAYQLQIGMLANSAMSGEQE